jgi:hypothetical protein
VNRRSAPQQRTHYDSGLAQRSWRTVETVRSDANATIARVCGKTLAGITQRLNRDIGRKNAGKKGVQGTAVVTKGSTFITLMTGFALITRLVRVLVKDVRSKRVRNRLRVRARGGHDARKLGEQKQGDQRAHQTRYRPEQPHQRFEPTPWEALVLVLAAPMSTVGAVPWNHFLINPSSNQT